MKAPRDFTRLCSSYSSYSFPPPRGSIDPPLQRLKVTDETASEKSRSAVEVLVVVAQVLERVSALRNSLHCLHSDVLPAGEHKARIRNSNQRACIPSAGGERVQRVHQHAQTRGVNARAGRKVVSSRRTSTVTIASLYLAQSIFHTPAGLRRLRWKRPLTTKSAYKSGLGGLLSLVIGDRLSAAFRPPDSRFSDSCGTRLSGSVAGSRTAWTILVIIGVTGRE